MDKVFIISTTANLNDLQPVTQRLLRNPGDFAKEFQKYYGAANAERFAQLLTEHLTIAAQLVNQAKAGDTAAVTVTRREWFRNADEIAKFLASINRNWDQGKWQSMLYSHLDMTEDEAVLRLSGQYAADVAIYDKIEAQALEMADYMATGTSRYISP